MTMIERVARAILKERGLLPQTEIGEANIWRLYDKQALFREARAAIEAMRAPTEAMLEADGVCTSWDNVSHIDRDPQHYWGLMIDAALAEQP